MQRRIRAALAKRLRRIEGLGLVHPYERFSKNEKTFRELYSREGKLLGWHIRRGAVRETQFSSMYNRVRTRWTVRGLAALVDAKASELTLDALVDDVRRTFRRVPLLADSRGRLIARTSTDEGAGVQVEDSGPVMFAGLLCHSVRLGLVIEHFEEIEPALSEFAEVTGYDEDGQPVGEPCPDGHHRAISVMPGDEEWRRLKGDDNG